MAAGEPDNVRSAGLASPQGIELSEIALQGISWPRGQATRLGHGRRQAGQRPLGRPGQPAGHRAQRDRPAREQLAKGPGYQAWPWPQASRTTSARQAWPAPQGIEPSEITLQGIRYPHSEPVASRSDGERRSAASRMTVLLLVSWRIPPGRALPLADPLCWPRGQCYQAWPWPQASRTTSARQAWPARRASSPARSPCRGSAGQGARLPGLAMAAGEPDNVRSAGLASPQGIELSEIALQGNSWSRGQATRLGHGRRRAGQRPLGRPGQPRRVSSPARSPCRGSGTRTVSRCSCLPAGEYPQGELSPLQIRSAGQA